MASHNVVKDPDSVVNYTLEWHEWLNGDVILTSTWAVTGGGGESPISLTVVSSSIDTYTGQSPVLPTAQTTVVVSGGTSGEIYELTNSIETDSSLEGDQTIQIRVWDK